MGKLHIESQEHSIAVEVEASDSIAISQGTLYIDGVAAIAGLVGKVHIFWEVDSSTFRNPRDVTTARGHTGNVGVGAVGHAGNVSAIAVEGNALAIGHAGNINVAAVGVDAVVVGHAGDINVAAIGDSAVAVGFKGNISVAASDGKVARIGHGDITVGNVLKGAVIGHGRINVAVRRSDDGTKELPASNVKGLLAD